MTSNFQIDTVCVSSRKPRVPLATVLFNKTSSRFSGVTGPQQRPPPHAKPINVIITYADDTVVGFISDGDQIKLFSHAHIFSFIIFDAHLVAQECTRPSSCNGFPF